MTDQFEEVLINQYRDLIMEAIIESETDHKTSLNIGKLNSKLQMIYKSAECDGLPEEKVNQLIDELMAPKMHKVA